MLTEHRPPPSKAARDASIRVVFIRSAACGACSLFWTIACWLMARIVSAAFLTATNAGSISSKNTVRAAAVSVAARNRSKLCW